MPPAGIGGLALGLHLQSDTGKFVAAIAQLIAVAPLQHQKTAAANLKPTARMGHLSQLWHLKPIEQAIAADLAQLHPHGSSGFGARGRRTEKPQVNKAATSSSSSHSGGTTWGRPRRSSSFIPTRPTAR